MSFVPPWIYDTIYLSIPLPSQGCEPTLLMCIFSVSLSLATASIRFSKQTSGVASGMIQLWKGNNKTFQFCTKLTQNYLRSLRKRRHIFRRAYILVFKVLYRFRKIPYPPHERSLEILRGEGDHKSKNFRSRSKL